MKALPMQVTLQAIFRPLNESSPVVVDTNSYATVQTLISEFCTQKGLSYSSNFQVLDESYNVLPMYETLQSAGISSGQKLLVGYNDQGQAGLSRWPLFVAVAALIVGLIMILTLSLLYSLTGGKVPFDHGIVMDAGSTKTEMILYKWLGNKYKGTGCVKQINSCKVKGGIAKTNDIDGAITKIISCTKSLTNVIKPEHLTTTPLYFTATAGMRLLEKSDKSKADSILSQLNERLNETGLAVKNVSIIGGEEEGVYGWITTNFLKDSLDIEAPGESYPKTYGALDLGGASTQVTFTVPPTDENANRSMKLTLFGQDHFVYAKSYLCFGRDEAQRRYQVLLTEATLLKNPNVKSFDDPCAPNGARTFQNGTFLFQQPCTKSPTFQSLIKNNPKIAETNYTFIGSGNYEKCHSTVVKLLDKTDCENHSFDECFYELPRKLEDQKFVAFAAYYYTTNFLNVTRANLTEYENMMKTYCSKSYDEINKDDEHSTEYCFNAVYIHEILVMKYGFNQTTWKNLEFQMKIDKKSLGWTLGYMINATNALPIKKPTKKLIAPDVLIVCLLVFIIVVVATMVYISHFGRKKKHSTRSFDLK